MKALQKSILSQKSHTCEEFWAHLRISVWHLLMNLKNDFLFLRNCSSGSIKYVKNFNIYIIVFFKKAKKNTCRYRYEDYDTVI